MDKLFMTDIEKNNYLRYDKSETIEPDIKAVYKEVNGLKLPVYIYLPKAENERNHIGIVSIHGGGWTTGISSDAPWSGGDMAHQAKYFAKLGYVGIAISYRALQEGKNDILDLIEDCCDGIRYIKQNYDFIDPDKLILIGDSAGGHLVTCLGISEDDTVRPYITVACNPVLDCTEVFAYSSAKEENRIAASPLLRDIKKCSKFLFVHGDADNVTPIEWSYTLNQRLREQGFESEMRTLPGAPHAFILYGYVSTDEQADYYMAIISEYLDKKLLN